MGYVYRHIRLDKNEPFYIGIGSDSTYKRANDKKGRNIFWQRIVNKTDYEIEILFDDLSWEDACIKEQEFINLYGRIDKKTGTLCNLTDGGDGCLNRILSKESKYKIGKSNKGKKHNKEFREMCSILQKNRMNDPELYKKLCNATKNNKIKIRHIQEKKAVLQYDLSGNLLKEYDSIKNATIQFGKDQSPIISRCCNNKSKTGLGYIWKFKQLIKNK